MSVKMTEHQYLTRRVEVFSSHFRKLSAADRYADDVHGAHREANRLADLEIAAGVTAAEASAPLRARGQSSEALVAATSQTPEPDAAKSPFSWDTVIAETNARLTGSAPPASATASDFWDEAFSKSATAGTPDGATVSSDDDHGWGAIIDKHNAERRHR